MIRTSTRRAWFSPFARHCAARIFTTGEERALFEQRFPRRRGVDTTIIFPARNDSWIVGWASRSYYADLLAAGVKIYEYEGGLLHTKSLTIDGELLLIGSANMDRRSLALNYEINILVHDPDLTEAMRIRQREYIERSRQVTVGQVARWSMPRKLINNTAAILGPLF